MELQQILESFGLRSSAFADIQDRFTLREYGPNEVVFREGEPPDAFCFIKSGQALVSKRSQSGDDEPLAVLKEGEFFGEIGFLEEMERTATVRGLGDLQVFWLDREEFLRLLEGSDAFARLLDKISRARLLQQTTIFRGLDDESITAVQRLLVERTCPQGTVVFAEGDPPDALYVISKGEVRVSKHTRSGKEVTLAHLGQGDVFGEMGIIEGQPRMATVTTTEPSKLLMLPRVDFQALLREHPRISFSMLRMLSRRVRERGKDVAAAKGVSFFRGMTIISRPERCLSCKSCEIACAVSKSRTHTLYRAISEEPPPIKRIHVRKVRDGSEPVIRPEHCAHCRHAPCLTSCKFDAISRDVASGTIVISGEKCIGCGLCAKACPFNVVTIVRLRGKKRVALKCTYCVEHQAGPACVRSCPTNALVISLAPMPAT
jgi:carbon-monoxide dehydrogenase iron sulfur subunit